MRGAGLAGFALVGAALLARAPARGQPFPMPGIAADGQYRPATVNLAPGAYSPLLLDINGNLNIDCVVGCGSTASSSSGSSSSAGVTLSTPTGGNVAVTTTAASAIPASLSRKRWSYQVQGTGQACGSWVTSSPTISVSASGVVTCGGDGAFALGTGSHADSSPVAVENTPFTVIGWQGTGTLALNIAWEAQ